ncbi:hypothetical protein AB0I72_01395 [Nocardiopsis sp. NPDC049922]|uniref:hypothetical protein n=1 Tax=Nocardiopsis sp. NPDC049922 TaxID=3155157 RepID=UPI0033FC504D
MAEQPGPASTASPSDTRPPTPRRPAPLTRAWRWTASALVGTAPSPGEVASTLVTACAGAALAVSGAWAAGLPTLAIVVIGIVAFDFFGGAVATSTSAAKRRYHAPERGRRHHLGFVAVHVQPFLLALVVPGLDWWTVTALYLFTLTGAVAVALAPPTPRRPLAFAFTVTGTATALLWLPVPAALTWLAPVMLVKLLLGHMLPETGAGAMREGAHGAEESRPRGTA